MNAAERIVAASTRQAYAEGARDFARQFGNTLAALIVGIALGLFAAWIVWLFWLGAVETWTVLVSPLFIAAAELIAIAGLLAIRKLFKHPAIPE